MANSTPVYSRSGAAFSLAEQQAATVCDLGSVDSALSLDLSTAKLFYAASITGTITVTVANLPAGAEVILDFKSHATPPTVTWAGVDVWLAASAPSWKASKTTRIRLVHNGHQVAGTFENELVDAGS
jgi:hypothetical protein